MSYRSTEPFRVVGEVAIWQGHPAEQVKTCLLYTSDAADERSSVDLGGRRIIKKKKKTHIIGHR